jgi:hypothetical protein
MASINNNYLVSSFQNFINQENPVMQEQVNKPRPLRSQYSKQQSSQLTNELTQLSTSISNVISTPSPASPSMQTNSNRKFKLRSETLSIDFNVYKAINRNCRTTVCCTFCKNNGEPEHVYTSHQFKDLKGVVVCPVLQNYKCPMCGESGDKAHTITYCKEYKNDRRKRILSDSINQ